MTIVRIIDGDINYRRMFQSFGFDVIEEDNDLDPDLVCFTGGEDVSPELYGDKKHQYTYSNPHRDAREIDLFEQYLDIPKVGICRGGQFLNVMNGGRMYQHVQNHTRNHMLIDSGTGLRIPVTSTHHQMFMPHENAIIIATAQELGRREWYDRQRANEDVSNMDYEVLFYEDTNSLCFQPHPEFPGYKEMTTYFRNLLAQRFQI